MPKQAFKGIRVAVVGLAAAQTIYWLYAVWIAAVQDPMGDGLDSVPAFMATPPFILFTAPALLLGLINRGLIAAAILAAIGLVLTPLVLWQILFPESLGRLMDLVSG